MIVGLRTRTPAAGLANRVNSTRQYSFLPSSVPSACNSSLSVVEGQISGNSRLPCYCPATESELFIEQTGALSLTFVEGGPSVQAWPCLGGGCLTVFDSNARSQIGKKLQAPPVKRWAANASPLLRAS